MQEKKHLDFIKLEEIDTILNRNIFWLKCIGALIFFITVACIVYLFFDFKSITDMHLKILNEATENNETEILIYLLFRTSALASIVTTGIIIAFRMATQSFDQSMRFVKRRIASNYLIFLYTNHNEQFRTDITLEQIMSSFWVWNLNVESAFSGAKKKDYKPDSIYPNLIFKKSDSGEVSNNNTSNNKADKAKT